MNLIKKECIDIYNSMDYFQEEYNIVNSYRKALRVIKSCQTKEHLTLCKNYIKLYLKSTNNYKENKINKYYNKQITLLSK